MILVVIAANFIIIAIAQCEYLWLICFLGYLFATSINIFAMMSFVMYFFKVVSVIFLESFYNVTNRSCTALGTLLPRLIQRIAEMYWIVHRWHNHNRWILLLRTLYILLLCKFTFDQHWKIMGGYMRNLP